MKAVRIHHTGGPDVLVVEDVETPKPPPGTVLVKVGVSGVNYTDVMARQGIYMSRESGRDLPRTMGTEVAGVVTAVGEGVEPDLVGSRVVAFVEGGYAEYAVADRRLTFRLPESVELGDAVAFLVQGITAWELLVDRARLREGETVLVHSAAGGVGSLAVQLAHHLGASRVIATASTASKLALASRLGATDTVNYTEPGWADRVLDLTDGRGVDVVVEAVGGEGQGVDEQQAVAHGAAAVVPAVEAVEAAEGRRQAWVADHQHEAGEQGAAAGPGAQDGGAAPGAQARGPGPGHPGQRQGQAQGGRQPALRLHLRSPRARRSSHGERARGRRLRPAAWARASICVWWACW